MTSHVNDIIQAMLTLADEKQKAVLVRFFKTGKGQYGEGDHFLGVKNPQTRMVVKEVWKSTTIEEAAELARNRWHEVRLCGLLILVEHFQRAMKANDYAAMTKIFDTYTSLHEHINNWDLVDLSVYKIAGVYEMLHPETTILDEWISPGHSLWQRRMSMFATWKHIRCDRFDRLTARAEGLLDSKEDLLHKAAGWMLREMYKHSEAGRAATEAFLERHVGRMPSVMLSYAMEKMREGERAYWRGLRELPAPRAGKQQETEAQAVEENNI